jgi:hypothetical protein
MYSFRSPSTTTLWEAPPEYKLYLRLTNITNQAIRFHNQTDLIFMPSFAKNVLFNANLINTFLDRNSKSCAEIAKTVNEIIEPHLGSHKFYREIKEVIEPYLEVIHEETTGAQP